MPDLAAIVQGSAAHAWLYLPVAVLLGAMHALEPGHAKSLMAAYIVAIRGTAAQAVVLGISDTVGMPSKGPASCRRHASARESR
jgi:nickel/cobalt transporter (NicO) family protein